MKKVLLFFILAAIILLSGCAATGPYIEKPEDRLSDKEKYHLFDYSRHFINRTMAAKEKKEAMEQKRNMGKKRREVKQNDLTPQERESVKKLLVSKDPTVRVRYTGHKQGKLSLSWVLPGKLQIIVSAEGKLDLSGAREAEWRLNIIRYKRDCYMLPEELGIPAVD